MDSDFDLSNIVAAYPELKGVSILEQIPVLSLQSTPFLVEDFAELKPQFISSYAQTFSENILAHICTLSNNGLFAQVSVDAVLESELLSDDLGSYKKISVSADSLPKLVHEVLVQLVSFQQQERFFVCGARKVLLCRTPTGFTFIAQLHKVAEERIAVVGRPQDVDITALTLTNSDYAKLDVAYHSMVIELFHSASSINSQLFNTQLDSVQSLVRKWPQFYELKVKYDVRSDVATE